MSVRLLILLTYPTMLPLSDLSRSVRSSVEFYTYHILHTVRYQLMKHGINDSWQTISSKLSTHYRITNSLQRKDIPPIHIRKSTRANPTQLAIYNACNIPSTILKPTITSC